MPSTIRTLMLWASLQTLCDLMGFRKSCHVMLCTHQHPHPILIPFISPHSHSFPTQLKLQSQQILALQRTHMATTHTFSILKTEESMSTGRGRIRIPVALAQPATTRWNPTAEQLMILEELYRSGMRTPNAEQIQQITAHLSLYGKIEGKNVFYWFQNHKARDRQKLRRRLHDPRHHSRQDHHHQVAEMWRSRMAEEVGDSSNQGMRMDDIHIVTINNNNNDSRPLQTLQLFPTCSGF